jgi:RNA polymerase sigma-70 factor (ECF subfamily)
MRKTQDWPLVQALRSGEARAVEHWYRLYQKRLTAFVSRKVSNPADVEELVQETFINTLRSLPEFVGQASLWTWMCAIAKHEIGDYYRKKYAKKVLQLLPLSDWLWGDFLTTNVTSAASVSEISALTHEDLVGKLEQVWQKIGADYCELLQEKYLDQLSVAQLAAARGKTVKAVESELFRARRAFKKAYQEVNQA